MKLNKSKLLAFAKLIKCVQEVNTNNGVLISEGEIAVGTEVFIADENGDLAPATDGVYETENVIYTIESGIVTAIEEKPTLLKNQWLKKTLLKTLSRSQWKNLPQPMRKTLRLKI